MKQLEKTLEFQSWFTALKDRIINAKYLKPAFKYALTAYKMATRAMLHPLARA